MSEDTFSEVHSLDEPSDVEFREVTPPDELDDPISIESSLELAPIPSISPLSSPLLFFSSFFGPSRVYFCRG